MFVLTSSFQFRDYRIYGPETATSLYNILLKDTGLLAAGCKPVSLERIQSLDDIVKGFGCTMIIGGELAFVHVAFEEDDD